MSDLRFRIITKKFTVPTIAEIEANIMVDVIDARNHKKLMHVPLNEVRRKFK